MRVQTTAESDSRRSCWWRTCWTGEYENFGLIGEEPDEIIGLGDIDEDVRFLAPGAPLALWAGVKVYF